MAGLGILAIEMPRPAFCFGSQDRKSRLTARSHMAGFGQLLGHAKPRGRSPQRGRVARDVPSYCDMKHFLVLSGLLMAASLIAPVATMADGDDHRGQKHYYDRDTHDYHYWCDDEDRQYRAYLVEWHRVYVPFVRVKVRRQREYFKYRHEHGFKIEVR